MLSTQFCCQLFCSILVALQLVLLVLLGFVYYLNLEFDLVDFAAKFIRELRLVVGNFGFGDSDINYSGSNVIIYCKQKY